MASIIEGYNYDIFISYRQKDNKHDGWVTEFVKNLKDELESTFKEEISVYFDINPHDGLLETDDVDASLKEKLKCLILIPIISRTYCDPKSFAWEHEFKAFVEMACGDQFGLKVKLPNGNVASRVMPVKIHDPDPSDIKEYESVLLGVLRGVEFIYKEAGVNRPLSPEDKEEKNLNGTKYKNQINKSAIAVRELIEGIKCHDSPENCPDNNTQKHESLPRKSYRTLIIGVVISLIIISGFFLLNELHPGGAGNRKNIINDKSDANPEAYNLILQGRFFWNRQSKDDLMRSIEYYEKALSIDSGYAPAYAGLADSYYAQVVNSQVEYGKTGETYAKAESMAMKAISLDNTLAEPHGTLGCIRFYRDMKWEESRGEFKLAISLNPTYPEIYYQYAQLLDVLREKKEARSLMNKAIEMNPFQPDYRYRSADLYYNEGKFNESISEARKSLELSPGRINTYQYFINSYLRLGEDLKAFESLQESLSFNSEKSMAARNMKWAKEIYDSAGFDGILYKLIEAFPENYYTNATRYSKLGKKDEAIRCLENAYKNHTPAFFRINCCYDFNFLRSDPRFQALLEKIGLADYQ
ncbi:MAG: hypothetical protein ACM3UT_03490 [Chloroflexota bacterium]